MFIRQPINSYLFGEVTTEDLQAKKLALEKRQADLERKQKEAAIEEKRKKIASTQLPFETLVRKGKEAASKSFGGIPIYIIISGLLAAGVGTYFIVKKYY